MTFNEIIDLTWIPLIAFALCLGYGVALLITKNPKTLRGKKDKTIYKDSVKFATTSGWLLLLMAAGSMGMCVLIFYNVVLALVEVITVFLVFVVLWRQVNKKYGAVNN